MKKSLYIFITTVLAAQVFAAQTNYHCPDPVVFAGDTITVAPYGYPVTTGYTIKGVTSNGDIFSNATVGKGKPPVPRTLVKVIAHGESLNCYYQTRDKGQAMYLANFGDMAGQIQWLSKNVHGDTCQPASAENDYCQYEITQP